MTFYGSLSIHSIIGYRRTDHVRNTLRSMTSITEVGDKTAIRLKRAKPCQPTTGGQTLAHFRHLTDGDLGIGRERWSMTNLSRSGGDCQGQGKVEALRGDKLWNFCGFIEITHPINSFIDIIQQNMFYITTNSLPTCARAENRYSIERAGRYLPNLRRALNCATQTEASCFRLYYV